MTYFETARDSEIFYQQDDNVCAPHMHRSIEFLYVVEGEKRVWLNGKRYDLQTGDFMLCPPYCVHCYERAQNGVQIAKYIDEEYGKPLTLSALASRFGYSPNYFSWLFKRHFQTSFPQYLNGIRVRKSLPLLRTKKVYAVCYECGFNSPQQYYLHFKKFYGCTPKEFLKSGNRREN